jgi:dolichol-phosphate mannosyltransferase
MQAGTGQAGCFTGISPDARILVCVATYNERDNLRGLVEGILANVPQADILVIDDNSPDGTGDLADELAKANPAVAVLHRTGKLGLGTALLAGCRHAIAKDYDYAIIMDADFSHPPRYLPALLSGMASHDVMIGSRYIPGGGTMNWPWSRRMISKGINLVVRGLFGMGVRDASGAFRCYRVEKLKAAKLERIISRGYSFQQELLYRCFRAGSRLAETPIIFENRRAGSSKVNLREASRSFSTLVFLGLKYRLGLDRLKALPLPTLTQ